MRGFYFIIFFSIFFWGCDWFSGEAVDVKGESFCEIDEFIEDNTIPETEENLKGCGNSILEPGEQCDDGNLIDGDGCDSDCSFSCTEDRDCNDDDICNGNEVCEIEKHVCRGGVNLPEGTPCNDGFFCTAEDYCDGRGRCAGSGNPCADNFECTINEMCDEGNDSCFYDIADGSCFIDGMCYRDGDVSQDNPCLYCNPSISRDSWTPLSDASPCPGGICCSGMCFSTGTGIGCCSDSDCPQPSCSGTPTPCSDFTEQVACENQQGCEWISSGMCEGIINCFHLPLLRPCLDCNCQPLGSECTGGTIDCSQFLSQSQCTHCRSCNWVLSEYCIGSPLPCDSFSDSLSCGNQVGCSWLSYRCINHICEISDMP